MSSAADPPVHPDAARFVPLLTEVVSEEELKKAGYVVETAGAPSFAQHSLTEQQIQKLLHVLNEHLEVRLREAVGRAVSAHTQTLLPALRAEIEGAVRQAVQQTLSTAFHPHT